MNTHIEHLNKVIEKKPAYKELLNLYLKILEEQKKIEIENKDISYELESVEIIKQKMRQGLPLLDRKRIEVNFEPAKVLFRQLVEIFKEKIENTNFQEIYSTQDGKLDELLKKIFLDKEEIYAPTEDRLPVLIGKLSLQPLTRAIAGKFKSSVDQKLWQNGYCPICGGKPDIAEIKGEEGKKYLHCSFCGYEWLYKRLTCPYCGNTDHQTLSYFYAENEESYRIDTCEKCKHYIKTVDSRKLTEPVNLDIEDWCTIHLDFIAAGKGYQKEKSTLFFTPLESF
ncbi:MAG TPA: hypothetical protein DHV62_01825 [Elusimicrobia bacterium]|jgi:FdhE protein|nr:hypothetical protein [Elusimicrobiota bacterium]